MEFNRLNYIIIYLKNQSNPHRSQYPPPRAPQRTIQPQAVFRPQLPPVCAKATKKHPVQGVFHLWRRGKILRRTPYNKIQGLSGNFCCFRPHAPDYSIIGCITLPKSAISRKIQQYKQQGIIFAKQGFYIALSGNQPHSPNTPTFIVRITKQN